MASTHDKRRKVRAAEAKRDALLIKAEETKKELAKARLSLKQARKSN